MLDHLLDEYRLHRLITLADTARSKSVERERQGAGDDQPEGEPRPFGVEKPERLAMRRSIR